METLSSDHEYFKSDYYNQISELVEHYQEEFHKHMDILNQSKSSILPPTKGDAIDKGSQPRGSRESTNKSTSDPREEASQPLPQNGLVRKLDVKMLALERLLAGISIDSEPPQYFKLKKEVVYQNWQQIENLYESIWEEYNDPVAIGVNLQKYLELESISQNQIVDLSIRSEQSNNNITHSTLTSHSLPLPKLTIPKFDGDYLKWSQFFDLFTHMVDKHELPNVQKMNYLKSNVSGEAARLINHLAVTEENYQSAWTLLQERYNNKRLLAATLVHKILNQSSCNGTASSIKELHDTTQECLLALNNLGIETDTWDALLLQLLIKKLDRITTGQ